MRSESCSNMMYNNVEASFCSAGKLELHACKTYRALLGGVWRAEKKQRCTSTQSALQ